MSGENNVGTLKFDVTADDITAPVEAVGKADMARRREAAEKGSATGGMVYVDVPSTPPAKMTSFDNTTPAMQLDMAPLGPPRDGAALDSEQDLKAQLTFTSSTTDGVLKRTNFMWTLSKYPSAPEFSIGVKQHVNNLSEQRPAPGTYAPADPCLSKHKAVPKFSFSGGARFGLAASPTKRQPGPGAYTPLHAHVEMKVGFGTSVRNKRNMAQENAPGPGAYEVLPHTGVMFTARGRDVQHLRRSRSLPGPGSYSPTLKGAYTEPPKCGFGTSTRAGLEDNRLPGPGTYEIQNWKTCGKDSQKCSATSRRQGSDLDGYTSPGPGTYNSHTTCFGSPGAPSCRQVDEAYLRDDKGRMAHTA